ncbi:GNAT family N-acetyltransferase [Streptomyces sp. NPDC001389]|uniref:GNAT family N-acetyltransferase n=1 Tax=unclassified Streptomyces TaxID=2593676 RepID=UPI0036A1398F
MTRIRAMGRADIEAVSTIRVRGWRAAYAGLIPRTYLDAMTVEDDAERRRQWFARPGRTSRDLVALGDGGPVGWICLGPCRDELPDRAGAAEVYALYVTPDLIGTGIGRRLLDEAHAGMRDEGFTESVLWVLDGNERARRFYERAGYRPDGAARDDDYDGTALTELRYRRRL